VRSVRSGRGLGDTLYLQAVVRHLAQGGETFIALSDYPDVFRPLGPRVVVQPFNRVGATILAHYTSRKGMPGSTQFEDCCLSAGIRREVQLRLDWPAPSSDLVRSLRQRADGRPMVCVQLPRAPMGRTDGFGSELLPNCRILQDMVTRLAERVMIVQIGSGRALHQLNDIDVNLANGTTIAELLDVASVSDGFLGYPSFIIPLAESFDKPAVILWANAGLKSSNPFVRQITPEKLLHKPTGRHVVDTWPAERIQEVLDASFI
jgi:hypothetical protein